LNAGAADLAADGLHVFFEGDQAGERTEGRDRDRGRIPENRAAAHAEDGRRTGGTVGIRGARTGHGGDPDGVEEIDAENAEVTGDSTAGIDGLIRVAVIR
jgi:hypothetical protein